MKKILLYLIGCLVVTGGAWATLQDGLVAYWPLEDNLNDVTGNGHNGTAYSSTGMTYVTGKIGQAVEFNASGTGVNTGVWSPNVHNGPFSIACWARWKDGSSQLWQGLIGKSDYWSGTADTAEQNNMHEYWYLELGPVNGTNTLHFDAPPPSGGNWGTNTSTELLTAGQWRHVTATYENGTATLYVDGQQVGSNTITLDERDWATNPVFFGCKESGPSNLFSGAMDEVAIWNRALSAAEVAQLYNNGDGTSLAGEKWQAVYLAPADKTVDIPLAGTKLQWAVSPDPAPGPIVRYDVYLGTDYALVSDVADPNKEARVAQLAPTVFEYNTQALTDDTNYFWRIDTVLDDVNIAFGKVFSFRTIVMTPIITQQPQDVSVGPGGWPVSFSVVATSNDGAISYKWLKKGSATVLGTSDTLSITATAGTQGQYYCELTNAYTITPVITNVVGLSIVQSASAGLTAGMVGYWPLNDGGADASGNGLSGTVNGNTAFVTGKIGGSAALDGLGDFIQIPNTPVLDLTNAITVATWAKVRNAWSYGWESIVCKGENSWRMQRDSANRGIEWAVGNYTTYNGSFGTAAIDDGQWHLIVGTTDGTTEKLFVDGILDAQHTTTGTPPIQVNTFGMRIGSNPENTARDFDGWLDETAVWNRALSTIEIASLYSNGQGVALVNQWQTNTPSPDGSAWVDPSVDLNLGWQLGSVPPLGAQYQVYFGEFGEALTLKGTTTYPNHMGFVLPKANLAYDKKYSWRVDTTFGSVTQTGPVWSFETIKLLPIIVTNPVNVVVPDEGTASFTFVVTSPTEVTYNWYKQESGLLVGTGNPLVLTNVSAASEGYYYCDAINADGTTRSASASLMLEQLLAHWKMNETVLPVDTGALIKDSTVFMHDGTKFGDVHSVDGMPLLGNAMAFDGTGDYIDTGTWNPNARSAQLTITLWAKWAGLNGQYQGLIGKRNTWGGADPDLGIMMWFLELNVDTGALNFARRGSSIPAAAALPIDEWAFVAVTFDGTNATIYRDGLAVVSGAFSLGSSTDAQLVIGASEINGGNPFNGALDDVRIYNYALDGLEIAHLYTDGANVSLCMGNPAHDLDGNCRVGLNDVAIFAAEWMKCNLAPLSACQ